jgi:hypothetical protein
MKSLHSITLFISLALLLGCKTELPGVAPEAPTLLIPEDATPCEVGEVVGDKATVLFEWQETAEALFYTLEIKNLTTEEVILIENIESTSHEILLDRGHYYEWTITALNYIYKSRSLDRFTFYLSAAAFTNTAPAPPVAIYPEQGQTVSVELDTITLRWSSYDADLDDLVYELIIANSEDLSSNLTTITGLRSSEYQIQLSPSTEYFWKIEAFDGQSRTESQVFSFRTTPN